MEDVDRAARDGGHASALSTLDKLVGIAIAVVTAWAAYQSSAVRDEVAKQSADLEKVKIDLSRQAQEREDRKLNQEITLRIFEEVKDVYKTVGQHPEQTLNRLLSVAALVEAIPDAMVRARLAAAVSAAADSLAVTTAQHAPALAVRAREVKTQVDVALFRAEQGDAAPSPPAGATPRTAARRSTGERPVWTNYDFDFFWCERGPNPDASRQAAESAAALKALDPDATGRWRVRKLPAAINRQAGYRIDGYVIRVSSVDEEQLGSVLKDAIRRNEGPEFELERIAYPTPWYLSVFFCPESRPGS